MTRSYGGGPERQGNRQPDLRGSDSTDYHSELDSQNDYHQQESDAAEAGTQQMSLLFGKRLVAMLIDAFVAFLIGQTLGLIPYIGVFLSMPLVMTLVLILRDFFFEGRGVGKNLMGLQVVDIRTGRPCSLVQSAMRNIILLGPPLALYIIGGVLGPLAGLIHEQWLPNAISTALSIFQFIAFIYVTIVIPYETYRAYSRADERRFGDEFAGTVVVEAPMNFSKPF